MMKRKKIFNKTSSTSTLRTNSANKISSQSIKKPTEKLASKLDLKSTSSAKNPTPNKRKSVSPKKVVRQEISSDSSSSSSESDASSPVKTKSKIVSKKITKKDNESSSDDSDSSSDESESRAGQIIRIPVDRSEQHKYYK